MRNLLLIACFLTLPLLTTAQEAGIRLFTKDSLNGLLQRGWRFADADRPELALPAYNDHLLPGIDPEMLRISDTSVHFKGVGWLRLRFRVDTSLTGKALALQLTQHGAAELYLDGKLIYTRGLIRNKQQSVYYDPHQFPFTLVIPDTAAHLLAIRYANWNYNNHDPVYNNDPAGFRIMLSNADNAFANYHITAQVISITCSLLFGVFVTLALLHLLLFLYNRGDRSNLLFSLFSLSLGLLLFWPYLSRTSGDPGTQLQMEYYSFFVAVLACFALSGFLNTLFAKKRRRFIIRSLCLVAIAVYLFFPDQSGKLLIGMLAAVAVEATVIILKALTRRVPGARIIGAGLSLFILLLLTVIILIFVIDPKEVHIGGTSGLIIFSVVCIAILSIPVSLSAFLARNFAAVSKDLKRQLVQVQVLSQKTIEQEAEKQRLLEHRKEELETEVAQRTGEVMRQKAEIERQHDALKIEKKKSDDLLLNILPEEVAEELKETGSSGARLYEEVSVLFTDFVGFTQHSERFSPTMLVAEIDECFKAFDGIIGQHGLEKIKTVGDAYIAVAGLPVANAQHAQRVLAAAIAIRDFMQQRKGVNPDTFDIRLGVHSGPVVAGIVGIKKFAYDIWGDTVNTAARMEQSSLAGKVNISATTYELVKDAFACSYRGEIEAKHKGRLGMYFVEAQKPALPGTEENNFG